MPRAGRAGRVALLAMLALAVLAGCDDEGGAADDAAASQAPTADTDGDGDIDADDAAADEQEQTAEPVPPPTEPADIELAAGERSANQDGATITVEGASAAFVSPTGNIACVLTPDSATCQILDKGYDPPQDQVVATTVGSCAAGDADAMMLIDQQGAWTCTPEALTPSAAVEQAGWWEPEVEGDTLEVEGVRVAVLPYGETLRIGATTCDSTADGVTCSNSDTGRFFFLSRLSARYG